MTPGEKKALAVLQANPTGIKAVDIAKAIGHSKHYTRACLIVLRDLGMCMASSHGGKLVLWGTTENMPAVLDALATLRRERKKKADAEYKRRKSLRQRERKEAARDADYEGFITIRQRVVPAAMCEPIMVRAPASVFYLADAA